MMIIRLRDYWQLGLKNVLGNRSLLLYDKSGETGFQCDLSNGGLHVICIPDSLLLICKGKRVYKNAFLCQTNLNDAKSAPFVTRNEETKCLCFYFDREWRIVALWTLVTAVSLFYVVMLSLGRFLQGLTYSSYKKSAKNDCIWRGLLSKRIKRLNS